MIDLNLSILFTVTLFLLVLLGIVRMAVKKHYIVDSLVLGWILISLLLLLIALIPDPFLELVRAAGFQVASNGIFFMAIGIVALFSFFQSLELARMRSRLYHLTQEWAIRERLEKENGQGTASKADEGQCR